MTLQEAIEILSLYLQDINRPPNPDAHDAMELGIEAMKRLQDLRYKGYQETQITLPGETKE